jgi:carboxyl-terminal processing protease
MESSQTPTDAPKHHAGNVVAHTAHSLPVTGILLALMLAIATFFTGIEIGAYRHASAANSITNPQQQHGLSLSSVFGGGAQSTVDLDEFWRVWSLLEDRYVSGTTTQPLTDIEKVEGAIAGLVDAYGDPYTVYLPPADAEVFASEIAGNFQGVGMEIGKQDDILTVIAPLPETPAEKAGIRPGDKIVKIDGVITEGMSVDEAVKRIRGEKGTSVLITVFREGQTDFLELDVVRDTINIPVSKVEEQDDVFIIRLYNFSALSEAKMQEALRNFMRSGKTKLVIDLRGNPGGYLQSAVNIASYFLPLGDVVVRENYGEGQEEDVFRSKGFNLRQYRDFKTVVLVDGGSASASEILAGALREQGVATLVGTKTFGKGSVQELVDMPSGASLKVTIARWLTPNGHSISEKGIEPDISVVVSEDDRKEKRDPQLKKAIELLHE